MEKFITHEGLAMPLDRSNVDTDAIIPKQYLKSVKRTGFGPALFDDWRYLTPGEPGMNFSNRHVNEEFVLNKPRYKGASVLLARDNFGCGSSREHAVWALAEYGFRVVIAPSFADIFYNNSFKNGLLPIAVDAEIVEQLFAATEEKPGYQLTIDLENQQICTPDGGRFDFEIDSFKKARLLKGLDDIGITLEQADEIRAYEAKRCEEAPWLFPSGT